MKKIVTLRQALSDSRYLGGQLEGDSWASWRALLFAILGEPLTPDELAIFTRLTGRPTAPTEPVREFAGVIGRRGGKSRALGLLAAFAATCIDYRATLAPGERGVLPVLAQTKDQAVSSFNFIAGAIDASPALRGFIDSKTNDTLSLSTGVDVTVRPASFRSVRGINAVMAICDETAFWRVEGESANPDSEIIRALRPSLLNSKGPLVAISSPYARRGHIWEAYHRHFGPDGNPAILVAQAASQTMNPAIDMEWVARQFEEDPIAAEAEYNAQFRSDVEAFVDREIVEACIERGCHEIPPSGGKPFFGFVDAAGGNSGDAMTLAVAHMEGDVATLDCIRERKPPFSPAAVCEEFSAVFKSYGLTQVTADKWGSAFVTEAFASHGIECRQSAKPKSDIYRELLPMLMSGNVRLTDTPKLAAQIISLERKTARGGKDSIDHPPRMHDDLANAAAGALVGANFSPPPMSFNAPFVASIPRGQLGNMDPAGVSSRKPGGIQASGGPVAPPPAPEPTPEIVWVDGPDNPQHARVGDRLWTRGPAEAVASFKSRVARDIERSAEEAKRRAAEAAKPKPWAGNAVTAGGFGNLAWVMPPGKWGRW